MEIFETMEISHYTTINEIKLWVYTGDFILCVRYNRSILPLKSNIHGSVNLSIVLIVLNLFKIVLVSTQLDCS